MAKKLTNMTDAELEKRQLELSEQRAAIRAEGLEVQAERDRRAAAARVANFTDAERAALLQTLTAEGVASEEQAGTP